MYDEEGNYVGPALETAPEHKAKAPERRKKQFKRPRSTMESELALAALAPDNDVALQSPFAAQLPSDAPQGNQWWAAGPRKQEEKELLAVGAEMRLEEDRAALDPTPRAVVVEAAAAKSGRDALELALQQGRGLWEKTNAEKQHLAREAKPKRVRTPRKKEEDLGHFHKQDYYVPKGRAGNFSGMFVAKETGEML